MTLADAPEVKSEWCDTVKYYCAGVQSGASPATAFTTRIDVVVRHALVGKKGVVAETFHLWCLVSRLFGRGMSPELDSVHCDRLRGWRAVLNLAKLLKQLRDLGRAGAGGHASQAKKPIVLGRSGRNLLDLKHTARGAREQALHWFANHAGCGAGAA